MHEYNMENRSIQIKIVIIPIDEYTNEIITDCHLKITINGKRADIFKHDGYHIFSHILAENLLEISPGNYQGRRETVYLQEVRNSILYIRLLPSIAYKKSGSRTVIKGKGNPGDKIYMRFADKQQPYRLISSSQDHPVIHIYHAEDTFLEAKIFLIEEENKKERIHIVDRVPKGKEKKGLYMIGHPLQNQYTPHKCILKREYCVAADKTGEFYFMVPTEFAKTGIVEIEKDGQVIKKQFYEGKQNEMG